MIVGYARVSTSEQTVAMQTDALTVAGCEEVWIDEGVSGTKAPLDRPQFADLWSKLRRGDMIVIYRLDRLARNARAALEIVEQMDERGVALRSLDGITTEGAIGKLVLTIMAAVAEMEVSILRERTRDGLTSARARGTALGRPSALTDEQISYARQMSRDGKSVREIGRILGVGKSTVARAVAWTG